MAEEEEEEEVARACETGPRAPTVPKAACKDDLSVCVCESPTSLKARVREDCDDVEDGEGGNVTPDEGIGTPDCRECRWC